MTRVRGTWLQQPETRRLFDLYAANGFELYAVGGCVRSDLLGEPVADIDMSSNARPGEATAFLEEAGLKVVPTGVDHGTITVVSDHVPHEITTFRKDVETDGRRAVIAFSDRLEEDAHRRDFTINALYAQADGTIIDPVGGLEDIAGPRIRFIGNAVDRIREDYLRALRFFRFSARYTGSDKGFDADTLAAIAETLDGLNALSRERVAAELLKLLAAKNPLPSVMSMERIGMLAHLIPGADPRPLGPFMHVAASLGLDPSAIPRFAAIASEDMAKTLRLSRAQIREVEHLRRFASGTETTGELGYRLGAEQGRAAYALRCAFLEQSPEPDAETRIDAGAAATFPVSASDLMPQYAGADLGRKLAELETRWIKSNFATTREDLLK